MTTDEDKMIYKLKLHRDLIGWVIKELEKQGIAAKRTADNDSKGDILLIEQADASKAKQVIRDIQNRYNKK